MRLILASSSPRRRELLLGLGFAFEVIAPEIDESRRGGEGALAYARRLSWEKAEAVAGVVCDAGALILSADTVVVLPVGGCLLGKPRDAVEARVMLRLLRGRAHEVITAFSLREGGDAGRVITRHARTVVHMRGYSDGEIEAYIASGEAFDKAGGYAIQSAVFRPVARIEGSRSNVVGLPLEEVKEALGEMDYSALGDIGV